MYEDTAGLTVGDGVERTGKPLSVELGPGLLTTIFDGIQRPLKQIAINSGDVFIPRGVDVPALNRKKAYEFNPSKVKVSFSSGDVGSMCVGSSFGAGPCAFLQLRKPAPDKDGGQGYSVENVHLTGHWMTVRAGWCPKGHWKWNASIQIVLLTASADRRPADQRRHLRQCARELPAGPPHHGAPGRQGKRDVHRAGWRVHPGGQGPGAGIWWCQEGVPSCCSLGSSMS